MVCQMQTDIGSNVNKNGNEGKRKRERKRVDHELKESKEKASLES